MNDDVFLFRSKAVQSLKVFHFFLLFFTGRSEVKPTLTERGLWSCRVFAALLKDTSAWWIGALLTSSFSKSNHQSLILFLVLENAFYWNCRWSHFLCHHISPWAVSRHLANQITCKWMLLEPSPLFTLASIRLLHYCLSCWTPSAGLTLCWQARLKLERSSLPDGLQSHTYRTSRVSASGFVSSVVDASATVLTTLTQWACPNLLLVLSGRLWISLKIDLEAQRCTQSVPEMIFLRLPLSKIALYERAELWW